jgi:hypothetical protein
MTSEEGFCLVTRGLAFCCLIWFASNLMFLPSDSIAILHHVHHLRQAQEMGRFVEDETYWTRYYASWACARAIGAVVALWLGLWLYRGGVGVRKFFFLETPQSSE